MSVLGRAVFIGCSFFGIFPLRKQGGKRGLLPCVSSPPSPTYERPHDSALQTSMVNDEVIGTKARNCNSKD